MQTTMKLILPQSFRLRQKKLTALHKTKLHKNAASTSTCSAFRHRQRRIFGASFYCAY